MKRYVSFDWAAKKLLRSKANFGILEGFLSELFGSDIKILRLLDSESNKGNFEDKYNRVDLLVEDTNGELIIVVIQNNSEVDYYHRMLYGTSKLIVENISEGGSYTGVKKVISVNIVYFDLGQGDDYIYHGSTNFIGMNKKDELRLNKHQTDFFKSDFISEIHPEYYILKINKFNDIAKNTLDEWIYFLKNEDIKRNFHAKGLHDAMKKLDFMKLAKEEQAIYKRYLENLHYKASMALTYKLELEEAGKMGREAGEKIGRETGEKIGEKNNAIKTAKKMLADKIDKEDVKRYTGLTIDEINSL